jgi:transposase
MIQLTPQMKIHVVIAPVDFRAGIDGLCKVCRQLLSADPFSGALFVFRGRRDTSVKILAYDGRGFWLCQLRLSSGKFRYWPTANSAVQRELLAHELHVLLCGGDPGATSAAPLWRPIVTSKAA